MKPCQPRWIALSTLSTKGLSLHPRGWVCTFQCNSDSCSFYRCNPSCTDKTARRRISSYAEYQWYLLLSACYHRKNAKHHKQIYENISYIHCSVQIILYLCPTDNNQRKLWKAKYLFPYKETNIDLTFRVRSNLSLRAALDSPNLNFRWDSHGVGRYCVLARLEKKKEGTGQF